jgi:hypothetical protein
MPNFDIILVFIALGFVFCWTAVYVWQLAKGRKGFWKKTFRWIKNVLDSLWGAG